MNDAGFRAMLQASKERNKHNSYAYTDTPTSHEVPKFTRAERKGIDEVIRAITPRNRYMPKRARRILLKIIWLTLTATSNYQASLMIFLLDSVEVKVTRNITKNYFIF